MKKVLIACLLLTFTSCVKEGVQVEIVNSVSDYRVEKLFEVDGVSVYRFKDGKRYVYFTNRKGEVYRRKMKRNGKQTYSMVEQTLCE